MRCTRPELVPHFVPHMRYLRYLYQKYLILRYMEYDLISPDSLLHAPCSLLLTPCSLLLTPYSLLLAPCSLLLTPYSLLLTPAPYSLLPDVVKRVAKISIVYVFISDFSWIYTYIKCIIHKLSKKRGGPLLCTYFVPNFRYSRYIH